LHDCLNFAAIPCTLPSSVCEEEINSALFVAVATLEEGVSLKDSLQAILRSLTFEKLFLDSLRHEYDGKKKTQLGHKVELVESDYTRTVDRALARRIRESVSIGGERENQQA
jgi:hypothetical protein